MPSNLILFNKPFRVMSQFSEEGDKSTLADFIQAPNFYPAGRLDFDSEGLLLLTDRGALQHIIASPDFKLPKTYWVQVEGNITKEALIKLRQGIELKDGLTKPAQAKKMQEPNVWPRNPAVRHRKNIPTSWIELQIKEGKNRQVRRMTAAVGFPTLRLIRYAIGHYTLDTTPTGQWSYIEPTEELLQEVQNFEQQRKDKTPSSHRRSNRQKGRQISDSKRVSRRSISTKPTRRTRRK